MWKVRHREWLSNFPMSHSKKLNWTFSSGGLISESVISTKSGFSSDLFHVEADFKNIIYFSETHAPHM